MSLQHLQGGKTLPCRHTRCPCISASNTSLRLKSSLRALYLVRPHAYIGGRTCTRTRAAATESSAGSAKEQQEQATHYSFDPRLPARQRTDAPWEQAAHSPPNRTCLLSISIKDFALVEQQTLEFGQGLNAITGESGSGKSVLVEALALLLGAPSPPECVRAPAEMAVVEGAFWLAPGAGSALLQPLKDQGVPSRALPAVGQPAQLDIRREILVATPASSSMPTRLRSRCFINGCPVTLRALRALSGLLVDMNGQHSSLALADPGTQLSLLDRVAGCGDLVAEVSSTLKAMQAVEARLEELDELSDGYERALMRKMVDSVHKARIQPGEESGLRATVRAMEARRATAEQCHTARQIVVGDGSTGLEGGLVGGLRMLELQLKGVLTREANAASAAEQSSSKGGSSQGSRRLPSVGAPHRSSNLRSSGSVHSNGSNVVASSGPEEDEELDAVAEEVEEQQQQEARARETRAKEAAAKAGGHRDHWQGVGDDAEEGVDGEEEEEEEEEEHPLVEASLMLSEMRQQMSVVDDLVRNYARSIGFSVHEFESASERLRTIERLLRTHRCRSSVELLEAAQRAEEKLDAYEEMLANAEAWEAEMDELRTRLVRSCCALSAARRAAVPGLVHLVQSALSELAMGDARFDVQVMWTVEPEASQARESEALDINAAAAAQAGEARGAGMYRVTEHGLDRVVLRLAAGPSEPLRPLAAVASGGEAARIMLALKAASSGGVEVSAGVGAGTAHHQSADFPDGLMDLPDDVRGGAWADIEGCQGSGAAGEHSSAAGIRELLGQGPDGINDSEWGTHQSMGANGGSVPSTARGVPATVSQANRALQNSEGTNGSVHRSHQEGNSSPQPDLPAGHSSPTPHWVLHPPASVPHDRLSLPCEDAQSHSQINEAHSQSSLYSDQQPLPAAGHSQQQHSSPQQDHSNDARRQPGRPQVSQHQQQHQQHPAFAPQQQQPQHEQPASSQWQQQQQHLAFTQQQQQQQQQQLQHQPHVPILVLDELDSGVGSRLGSSVGAMLRRMAAGSSQVVCVTHLPQVACFAEHHVKVLKHFQPPLEGSQQEGVNSSSSSRRRKRGRITTRFAVLSTYEQRVQEVAEMMGMNEDVARNLLQQAWGMQGQQ